MNKLKQYIISQLNNIPPRVYMGLLALLFVCSITLIVINRKNAGRFITWLVVFEYVFFVFGLTVLYRKVGMIRLYYSPFWSYESIIRDGNMEVLFETMLNVVLFIPIGFLWGIASSKWSKRWQWFCVLIIGIGFSVFIEFLQYYFKKGCAEVDDVINNTLGCLIGFLLWRGLLKLYMAIKTQSAYS